MKTHRITRLSSLAILASVLATVGCDNRDLPTAGEFSDEALTVEAPAFPNGEALKVLTRNMYLGGSVGLVLGADFSDEASVVAAATALWGQVQATNFSERAEALAAEIDEARPHVVGIQEIPQYAVLDGSYSPIEVQDHLGILMEELQGLPYELATVQTNTVVMLPVLFQTGVRLVQYVDRIAVLVRTDLDVTGVASANYEAAKVINPMISILRGWIRVSADVGGVPYHFVNTHLEIQAFADTQSDQADELLNDVMNDLDGVTILLGDLNSDAEGGPGDPSWTPTYGTLLDAGFQDTWELDHPGVPFDGLTCCQADLVNNDIPTLYSRVDFILIRATDHQGSSNRLPGSIHIDMVGEEQADRTEASGLWPSDHTGLLGSFKVPSSLFRGF